MTLERGEARIRVLVVDDSALMGKQITSLSLTVTSQGIIRHISIVEADGVTNQFQLSGETDNVPAPASAFEFHPAAGVAIVDGSSPLQ